MKLKIYKIVFHFLSFLSDNTGGKPFLVKYKLIVGTLILGCTHSIATNSYQDIQVKESPPEVERILCYMPTIDALRVNVHGIVVDKDSIPIVGLIIEIKGSKKSSQVSTDLDGNFTITADPDNVLVFSMLGYETREILAREVANNELVIMQTSDITITCYIVIPDSKIKKK